MSFPDEDLERTFRAAFGADVTAAPSTWTFTDLSTRVLPVPISIRRAVAVGAPNTATTLATVTCDNDDGALTPNLATSPYWPYVDNGTPAEFYIRSTIAPIVSDAFSRTTSNGWGTADTGQAWTTSGTAADWSTSGTQANLAPPTAGTPRRALMPTTLPFRDSEVVYDAALGVTTTGAAANIFGVVGRYVDGSNHLWCSTEFDVGGTINLRVRNVVAADFSTFLAVNTSTGVTYTPGALIRTRVQIVGDHLRMRVWPAAGVEPTTWHIDIRQRAYRAAGRLGLQMLVAVGVTNTLPITFTVDNFTASQPRMARVQGYIADVRPTFLPKGDGTFSSTVQIDIAGVGSRLEKKDAPPVSPMRRSVEKSNPPPITYWPCEDADGSTVAVSAFPGQDPMQVTGPATFAFAGGIPDTLYQSRFGTKPMISLAAGAKLSGTVPATTVQTEWAASLIGDFYVPTISPPVTEMRICEWQTPAATLARWALIATTTGYQVRAYNDVAGTTTNVVTTAPAFVGQSTYTIEAIQNAGNIDVALYVNDVSIGSGSIAGTLAQPTRVIGNPDQSNVTASIDPRGLRFILGHFRVVDETTLRDLPHYTDTEQGSLVVSASSAWFHESAHKRGARLCAEERVPFALLGNPATTGLTVLNTQADGTFTTLMTDAVESESGGMLFESEFGYAMVPRSTRYNQSAALVIDMSTYARTDGTSPAEILVPQLDARLPNVITVQRRDGAEGTYAADLAYRNRRGTITQGYVLDVLTDDDPRQHAAWREHVNVDARDAFYPGATVDLAANPALIDAWLSCDMGSRFQRTNQPIIAGTGIIDQVILGITEVIGPRTWLATLDAAPAKVWDVGVVDSTVIGKADTDGSVLHTLASAGAFSIQVDVTAGPRWTTDPTQMPIAVSAAGVDMSVTAISGTSNPQTFTLFAALPRGLAVNAPISLTNPARAAL